MGREPHPQNRINGEGRGASSAPRSPSPRDCRPKRRGTIPGRGPAIKSLVLSGLVCAVALLSACTPAQGANSSAANSGGEQTTATYAMDTLVTQTAYGEGAAEAMRQVNLMLAKQEARLSLFTEDGDIARVNAAAGGEAVQVDASTAELLRQAQGLSAQSENTFAFTIAPLTLAWGITGDAPHVVPPRERDALLPLVDDAAVEITETSVRLPRAGMGIDLGGIAKGAACTAAAEIYGEYGVDSALLSIGGNVYARGEKPDGKPWRVGFRNPLGGEESYIASFPLQDEVIAVSGGYERYFEEDGVRYIHIIDPRTGRPAESDILSVGVIEPDGAVADFLSTSLYVGGLQSALSYMEQGGLAIVLDGDENLYVSQALEEGFTLYPEVAANYTLHYIGTGDGDEA